jgi:UDP-N-acetylmuramoyl-tripeptide--D-alanyl-D-alanine ligase
MATVIPPNRAPFTVEQIALATRGQVVRDGGPTVGVFTDSRSVTAGSTFVALAGDRFDGHAFLGQAAALGARTLVVSKSGEPIADAAMVRVSDTRRALGDMARMHRTTWAAASGRSIVAITGSAGKTTTKTVLARMLDAVAKGAVLSTAGNLNNDIGLPMTLFGLDGTHRYAVVEIGTNAPGEIANLAAIALPDVGVLTLVAAAHTEKLGTVDDVAREKGALFAGLSPRGLAVANADDGRAVAQLERSSAAAARTYGFSKRADYRIAQRSPRGSHGSSLRIERAAGSTLDIESPLLGDAGALAVAASIAVVEWLVDRTMTQDEVRSALAGLAAGGEGRLSPIQLSDGTLLIDDSYNANPASMRSSIGVAVELAKEGSRRVVLVLGEMRELGALSPSEHEALGRFAAEHDVAHVIGVGGDARLVAGAVAKAGKDAVFVEGAAQAVDVVVSRVAPGDVVLVKGSRSIGTERVVRALEEARGGRLA